jgi:hypothetical protein
MIVIMNDLRSEIKTQQQTIVNSRNMITTLTHKLANLEEEAALLRIGTVKNTENELNYARRAALCGQRRSRDIFNNIEPVLKSILYTLRNFESRLKYAELGGDVPACENKNVCASDTQSDSWSDPMAVARTLCSFSAGDQFVNAAACAEGLGCCEKQVVCGRRVADPKVVAHDEPPPGMSTAGVCAACPSSPLLSETSPVARSVPIPPPLLPKFSSNYSNFFTNNPPPRRNVQVTVPPPLPPLPPSPDRKSEEETFHEAWEGVPDLKALDLNESFDDKDCWR